MLIDLIKNIKQAAVTHALSTAIVVQGVAVQQTTLEDFSVMEAEILESSLEQREQAQAVAVNDGEASERYWQEINEMASASEPTQEANSQSIEPLVALYEDADPSEYVPSQGQSKSGPSPVATSSLVAISSNVPIAAPSVETASGERAKAPSRTPAQVGAGSANNLQVPASKKVENAVNSNKGSTDASTLDRQIASSAQTATGGAKDASKETVPESSNDGDSEEVSQSGSEGDGQQEEGTQGESEEGSEEESNEESEEEGPTAYEHLGSVYLVVNGQVSEIEITDNSVLELEVNDEYSIVVASEEDFGSVVFNLENIESLVVHNQIENQIPYVLNSDTGNQSSIRPYDFEGVSYQLDLTAYDGNGVGGEVLERRTIRFSVTLLDNQSGQEDDSDN